MKNLILVFVFILLSSFNFLNAQKIEIYEVSKKYIPENYSYLTDIEGEILKDSTINIFEELKVKFSKKMTYKIIVIIKLKKEVITVREIIFNEEENLQKNMLITNNSKQKMKYLILVSGKVKK